jgi:tetratricopeptide (TPR) repeat protein
MLGLGKLEFMLGNVDKAKYYLNNLLNTSNRSGAIVELGIIEYYLGNITGAFKYFDSLLHTKSEEYVLPNIVNMLIKEGYVKEAFEYFIYSKRKGIYCDPKAELYLMKYFNIFFINPCNRDYSYNNLQLIDYDEYVAVEHIISRHQRDFSKNIDIYELFNSIKEKISREFYIGKLVLNDIYDIPYEGIGKSDTLRVICIPGTKDILSMYPLTNNNDYEEEYRMGLRK